MRIVRLAKAQNITSIADFIAARYGKSQAVAATVALIAIVGTIPYIALQLKAVSASLGTILVHVRPSSVMPQPVLGDIALFVALAMAAFAMLFGTRHIDATEHQDGLMLAIATESVVKLVAFLAVGVFVTFWMFDGPRRRCSPRRWQCRRTAAMLHRASRASAHCCAMTLLSFVRHRAAAAAVPRHRGGEPQRGRDQARRLAVPALSRADQPVRHADRASPACSRSRRARSTATCTCWRCRSSAGSDLLALVAFIGGLSAATAMVIVETVALAIMVSNDIVMPLVLQRREALVAGVDDVGALLLTVRRVAIFVILLLAYHLLPLGRRRAARRRSACCRSPRSRNSRRPSSAGCSGGAAPRAAPSPA